MFSKLQKVLARESEINRATAMLPLFEEANPKAYDLSLVGMARTGAEVLRTLSAIAVGSNRPATEPIHEFIARHLGRDAVAISHCRADRDFRMPNQAQRMGSGGARVGGNPCQPQPCATDRGTCSRRRNRPRFSRSDACPGGPARTRALRILCQYLCQGSALPPSSRGIGRP